jgi:signal transduction histidine kinase
VVVLGRACVADLVQPPAGLPPVQLQVLEQCFHLVAGPSLVAQAVADGGHLVTPAWLAHWPSHLAEMGLAPAGAADFFHDFARELVLLDTSTEPVASGRARNDLAALAQALQLPARQVPVGLDTTRPLLARAVLAWRLAQAQQLAQRQAQQQAQQHQRELADHACMVDMLGRLARLRQEAEAIATIQSLLGMLFAPQAVHYLRVDNGLGVPEGTVPPAMQAALHALQQDFAWTDDGQGFLLSLGQGKQCVGKLAVDRLAFPEHRERYLNLALALTGVCALAIDNTRAHRKLLEAEKMAALSTLVAGVAHEIGSPLGVNLMAASTLQARVRQLAQRFAERRMTQDDLQQGLAQAEAETTLIRRNLERIGELVDSFRAVAVQGRAPSELPHARFRLRECIDDVLCSLGPKWPRDRVQVHIDCDPEIELDGRVADWASIFGNLLGNSLRHGFKGDRAGAITIAVVADAECLRVDYRDDGRGIAAEALAHVFDPFFTTDPAQGMGLGLHLVYNLVSQRLQGQLHCESPPGQGVHLRLEVPR